MTNVGWDPTPPGDWTQDYFVIAWRRGLEEITRNITRNNMHSGYRGSRATARPKYVDMSKHTTVSTFNTPPAAAAAAGPLLSACFRPISKYSAIC